MSDNVAGSTCTSFSTACPFELSKDHSDFPSFFRNMQRNSIQNNIVPMYGKRGFPLQSQVFARGKSGPILWRGLNNLVVCDGGQSLIGSSERQTWIRKSKSASQNNLRNTCNSIYKLHASRLNKRRRRACWSKMVFKIGLQILLTE